MAGAGYKLFVNGNTLSASDLNTYVQQQTVMVFATTGARDTALSSVLAEGMQCYITGTGGFYYNGSAWVANVSASSTTTFTNKTLTAPIISSPKISSTYTAKTASYTFASGDEGNIFSMNNAATQQFNIPTDATFAFAVGTEINVFWITGAGQPTIGAVTPGTTTVISTAAISATPKLRIANSGATIKKLATDSWIVFGDIA